MVKAGLCRGLRNCREKAQRENTYEEAMRFRDKTSQTRQRRTGQNFQALDHLRVPVYHGPGSPSDDRTEHSHIWSSEKRRNDRQAPMNQPSRNSTAQGVPSELPPHGLGAGACGGETLDS